MNQLLSFPHCLLLQFLFDLFQLQKYRNNIRTLEEKVVEETLTASSTRAQGCSFPVEQRLRPIAQTVQLLHEDKRVVESQVISLQRKVEEDMREIMAKVCCFDCQVCLCTKSFFIVNLCLKFSCAVDIQQRLTFPDPGSVDCEKRIIRFFIALALLTPLHKCSCHI